MKTNWQIKKIENIFLTILIIILVVVLISPFIYIYVFDVSLDFWNNTMGNMLATVLALIAGIPIALWIDRLVKSREENKKYLEERKREKEILQLIYEELNFSYNSLFLKSMKGNLSSITIQPLKSDLWETLISSRETKYIESPELLNRISSAYYVLRIVKNIQEQAYIALRTSALVFKEEDGTKSNSAQKLLKDARQFDDLFEKSTKEALKMINERLSKI